MHALWNERAFSLVPRRGEFSVWERDYSAMCGIFASIHKRCGKENLLKAALLERLKRRGPDLTKEASIPLSGGILELYLLGTLLRMRGGITPQPLANGSGDYLVWNGNVFGGEIQISPEENDTVRVLEELGKQQSDSGILSTLSKIHGPWAFVFWQASTNSLWFGRDVFGRRSLLWHLPVHGENCFGLSSLGQYDDVSQPQGFWLEVPALGIYQLRFTGTAFEAAELSCYPWMEQDDYFQSEVSILSTLQTSLNITLAKNKMLQVPFPSLNKQLQATPSVLVAVSDTETVVSKALVYPVTPDEVVVSKAPVHPVTPDEVAVSKALVHPVTPDEVAISKAPVHPVTPDEVVVSKAPVHPDEVNWYALAQQLIEVLQKAIKARVVRAPPIRELNSVVAPSKASDVSTGVIGAAAGDQGNARVAILFSGGVDSVVLAALTDRCLDSTEEIDLINVAFEQKPTSALSLDSTLTPNFDVPDRRSAIESLKELNPNRKWNLVLVDVPHHEVIEMRKERVSHLIYPLCTVLDDSIGCAIWFAARGEGVLHDARTGAGRAYQTRARALFVGMGADEQLAGYSRHRTRFNSGGFKSLIDEVEMDIKRLSRRNLGRDDRCIADHHREGQFPFLDEEVVGFLQSLPIWHKADLRLPRGMGEKKVLREVASLLGCHSAASLPKRAIQFGSRMAKLAGSSNSRQHGSDVCSRLLPTT